MEKEGKKGHLKEAIKSINSFPHASRELTNLSRENSENKRVLFMQCVRDKGARVESR